MKYASLITQQHVAYTLTPYGQKQL